MCALLTPGASRGAERDVPQLPDPCGLGPVQPGELQEICHVKAVLPPPKTGTGRGLH